MLGALLFLSIPSIIRYTVFKGVSTSAKARIDTLMRTPATFPPGLKDVKPFPPDVTAAVARVRTAFDSLGTTLPRLLQESGTRRAIHKLAANAPLTSDETTSFATIITTAKPILDETSAVAHMTGYTAEALLPPSTSMGWTVWGYDHSYELTNAWLIAIHAAAEQGDWEKATSGLETTWRLAQTDEFPGSNADRYRHNAARTLSRATSTISTSCTQVVPLRKLLDSLIEIRPMLVHQRAQDPVLVQALGKLRAMARDGFPVDLTPGKPTTHYAIAAVQSEMFDYPRYMSEHLSVTDPRQPKFADQVRMMENTGPGKGLPLMLRAAITFVPDVVLRFLCDENPITSEDERARANVDLTILTLATRIYQLEKSALPASTDDLLPYIGKPLTDPFNNKPYLWDSASSTWYSIGPDKVDNHLKSLSDSGGDPGDISIGAKRLTSGEDYLP
jgi:hypothetical protein